VRQEWAQRTVAVRINGPGSSELAADLELVGALRASKLTVVVPKVEEPGQLQAIAERLDRRIGLQALIETPAGVEAAGAIARSTQLLCGLILGYADLATALGRRGAERHIDRWLYHQEAVLAAARAAGVQAIDGPFLRLGDRLALARAARAARELGFDGASSSVSVKVRRTRIMTAGPVRFEPLLPRSRTVPASDRPLAPKSSNTFTRISPRTAPRAVQEDGCYGCACFFGAELVALGELAGRHDRAGEELQ
jgi:hypothetical protein